MEQNEDELDKKAWAVFRDALKGIEFPDYVNVSENKDGSVSFQLSISSQDGASTFMLFKPGIKVIKDVLELSKNNEDQSQIPTEHGKELDKSFAELFAHLFIKNFPIEIKEALAGLNEVPLILPQLLMAEIYSHSSSVSKDKKAKRLEQTKNDLESLLEERKQRLKKRILDEVEKREKPYKPAKHLISIYYEELLPKWEQAKICFKKNKTFNNWEKMVAVGFEEFPIDLIKRLGDPDTYIAMPSSIALEHASRFCGINDNSVGLRALQKYLQQSREWLEKVGKEEAEKQAEKHFRNIVSQVVTYYQVADLLGNKDVKFNSYSLLHKKVAKDLGNTIKRIIDEENSKLDDERSEDSFIH